MAVDEKIFGTDLINTFEVNPQGDIGVVRGLNNAEQRIYNRLMAKLDELEPLDYVGYGNKSYDVIGLTDVRVAENTVKIYTESCLKKEPVVEDIIDITIIIEGNTIKGDVTVKLIEQTHTTNLVFGLEVT